MIDERERYERAFQQFQMPEPAWDRLVGRRNRKRRNQRIAAGVVGIAAFVAAVWIVTSGLSFDRSETPLGPGPRVTGPVETGRVETGPAETAPPPALASAAPDVVSQEMCSDGARSRLELTDMGDRIEVRFEVHDSPPGHLWHIRMWRNRTIDPDRRREMFRGARVASDSGDFAVVRLPRDITGPWLAFRVKAIDSATGQVCEVGASIHH